MSLHSQSSTDLNLMFSLNKIRKQQQSSTFSKSNEIFSEYFVFSKSYGCCTREKNSQVINKFLIYNI